MGRPYFGYRVNSEGKVCCRHCKEWKDKSEFHNAKHPHSKNICKGCKKDINTRSKYRMSTEEFNKLLKKQDNRCAICRREFVEWIGNQRSEVYPCIDHDHKTHLNRGLVCVTCNLAIGYVQDSFETAYRLFLYLQEHSVKHL